MAQGEAVFVGDVGTKLGVTIKDEDGAVVDVSQATTKEIIFEAPDGTVTSQTAAFESDGTDGVIHYEIEDGDIGVAGVWNRQGHVITPAGEWYTEIVRFRAKDPLE